MNFAFSHEVNQQGQSKQTIHTWELSKNVNKQRVVCDRIAESRYSHISSSVMAEAVRQVATSAIMVSQHTVVIHNALVALQQDRERQQQEQVQHRIGRHRRQGSCWVRDWLLQGERLRHSHYYNLMESLREKDPDSEFMAGLTESLREKDPDSEFLAGCFDQTAAFFLLAFLLWPLVVTLVSKTVSSETGSVCWGGGRLDFHLPLPLPAPFLPPFDIMLDIYTTMCLLGKFWRINDETKIWASTRYVIFSFIWRSQAFVTFARDICKYS